MAILTLMEYLMHPSPACSFFTWTLVGPFESYFVTELVVDGVGKGYTISDSATQNLAVASATVLVYINAGDHVFIRKTGGDNDRCNIVSKSHARSTFSGWLLK